MVHFILGRLFGNQVCISMENGKGKRPSYPGNDALGKIPFLGNERLGKLSTIEWGSLPTQGMMNWGTSFPGDGELGNFTFPME